MASYLAHTAEIAENTPATRNRVVDFWRALAICMVVGGHWLAASIWLRPDGEIALMNSLEWIPYSAWVTWIVQVMPIFFLAGGYANAMALRRVMNGDERRADWITTRVRRLFTPVIPLIVFWTILIVALRPVVPNEVLYAGAMSATVPLWFMAIYLVLTTTAPFTYRWWLAWRWGSVAVLATAALATDIARFVFEVPGVGWLNFAFVWGAVHQIGFWWATRERSGGSVPAATGWAVFGAALGFLIAVTWAGIYPVAMVGVPGAGETNMTPPTFAMLMLGVVDAGLIWGTQGPIRRFVHRRRVWHVVVAISGVIMTLYLWHLSAMSLVAAVGLFAFGGAAFTVEPGTWLWWFTRPIWLLVLAAVTTLLVALFAPFEWRINRGPAPIHRHWIVLGVVLVAGSAAAVSYFGLATQQAAVNWSIPIAAVAGAAIMGAYPKRPSGSR